MNSQTINRIDDKIYPNLGLGYISSYLESKQISNTIIDFNVIDMKYRDVYEYVIENNYTAVGISTYYFNYKNALKIINRLRTRSKELFIFLGGYLPTLSHESMQNLLDQVNCFVIGEGEITTYEMLLAVQNNNPLSQVKGLVYKDINGNIVKTQKRELIHNLDTLPFPNRDIYNNISTETCIIASRGCFHSCSFCAISSYTDSCIGKKMRFRSAANVMKEIEELSEKGYQTFQLIDDNFIFSSKLFREFIDLLKNREERFCFYSSVSADQVIKYPDQVQKFMQYGLSSVFCGFESFLDKHLEFYNKKISAEQNIEAYYILGEMGIEYQFGHLIFNPITTINDIEQICDVLDSLKFYSNCEFFRSPMFLNSSVISTEGTPLFDYIRHNNLSSTNKLGYRFIDKMVEQRYPLYQEWTEKVKILYHHVNEIENNDTKNELLYQISRMDIHANHDITLRGQVSSHHQNQLKQFAQKIKI